MGDPVQLVRDPDERLGQLAGGDSRGGALLEQEGGMKLKTRERRFEGIPVREAKAAMHVQPSREDIRGATREDPENCAYARALKRTLDCQHVYVFKTVAYVESLDEKGQTIMLRYVVRSYAQDYLLR